MNPKTIHHSCLILNKVRHCVPCPFLFLPRAISVPLTHIHTFHIFLGTSLLDEDNILCCDLGTSTLLDFRKIYYGDGWVHIMNDRLMFLFIQ